MGRKKRKKKKPLKGPQAKQTDVQRQIALGDYHPEDIATEGESTDEQPGSASKVDVLAQRHAEGLPLWHADDKTTFRVGSELIGSRGDEHLPRRYAAPPVVGPGRWQRKKKKK